MLAQETASTWLEIDILGLRRTLERKGKASAIFELVRPNGTVVPVVEKVRP